MAYLYFRGTEHRSSTVLSIAHRAYGGGYYWTFCRLPLEGSAN